ncbi:MAG: hypothetical protein RL024_243 [Actinomycetota bacterium]
MFLRNPEFEIPQEKEIPSIFIEGIFLVAGAGFEPTTSGL